MRRLSITGCIIIASFVLTAASPCDGAAPMSAGSFRYERPVMPGGPGPNRLSVDVLLLAGAQPLRYSEATKASRETLFLGGLGDLRLYDTSGQEIGYLLLGPPTATERWQDGRLLPVPASEMQSGFEADLGSARRIDRLRLVGIPPPFLKRVRLEGSGDRVRWSILVADGTVFDLPDEGLRQAELSFTAGEFQYLRVVWNDENSAPVPLPQRVSAREVSMVQGQRPVSVPITFERRPGDPGTSHFRLHLPAAQLPVTALEFDCGGTFLLRAARQ